jgi:hypothetical protein
MCRFASSTRIAVVLGKRGMPTNARLQRAFPPVCGSGNRADTNRIVNNRGLRPERARVRTQRATLSHLAAGAS